MSLTECLVSGAHHCRHFNPSKVPSIGILMQLASVKDLPVALPTGRSKKDKGFLQLRHKGDGRRHNTDRFARLPLEIQEEIVAYLPTVDVLNLRYTSRTMAAIFDSQGFWKTRFRGSGERGFLSYLMQHQRRLKRRRIIDWRLLYHCTNEVSSYGSELRNRKRIWEINRLLRDMSMMTMTVGTDGNTFRQGIQKERELQSTSLVDDGLDWKEVPRDLLDENKYQPAVKYTQRIDIPRSLVRIGIPVLQGLPETYVTGLELICEGRDEANTSIGYRIPGNQRLVDTKALRGLDLAMGGGGIRAIRLIIADSTSSAPKWLGNTEYADMTIRLACDGDMSALAGEFDVSSVSISLRLRRI
jgi:hypothetical protein